MFWDNMWLGVDKFVSDKEDDKFVRVMPDFLNKQRFGTLLQNDVNNGDKFLLSFQILSFAQNSEFYYNLSN